MNQLCWHPTEDIRCGFSLLFNPIAVAYSRKLSRFAFCGDDKYLEVWDLRGVYSNL